MVYQHALRNALIPFVTTVGIIAGYLFGGAIVVEQVFALPGLGRLIVGAITERNYPLIQAAILLVTGGFVVINFLVDLLYFAIDPRVRRRADARHAAPRRCSPSSCRLTACRASSLSGDWRRGACPSSSDCCGVTATTWSR